MEKTETDSEGRVNMFMSPRRNPSWVTSASWCVSTFALTLALFACSRESPPPDPSIKSLMMTRPSSDVARQDETAVTMKGFVQDLEGLAIKNEEFRQVVYTATHCQLVVMALKPNEELGAEVHKLDQFFRIEEGSGETVLNGVRTAIRKGFAVLVPAGAHHNIINTGTVPMKLYTLYATPNHRDGVVHHTRQQAEADDEKFDGKTTE